MSFDAVLLAGGNARRLGGVDKADIEIGGATLLDRALGAVKGAERVIGVGPRRSTTVPVRWTSEVPAEGGPLRATVAGLELATSEVAVVLAVDYPFVTSEVVASLVRAARARDGAALEDATGEMHYVVGAYRTDVLRAAVAAQRGDDSSMRSLFVALDVAPVRNERAALDIDTPEDLERARAHASEP
ncbi:MAG: molybdenum cofactor guanylyltransferase [Actinomycetota bacterium]